MNNKLFNVIRSSLICMILPGSSAHLVILPRLFDWADQGLAFDVAVHIGSLVAVVIYFRRELLQLGMGFLHSVLDREFDASGRLAWMLIVATLPAVATGFFAHDIIAGLLRSPMHPSPEPEPPRTRWPSSTSASRG